jgi:hypothetical protein
LFPKDEVPVSDLSRDPKKDAFISPTARYRGNFTPEQLAFNSNLQEFASRVSLLCGLETAGKVSPDQAYLEIRELWHELKQSKQNLLDSPSQEPPTLSEE